MYNSHLHIWDSVWCIDPKNLDTQNKKEKKSSDKKGGKRCLQQGN